MQWLQMLNIDIDIIDAHPEYPATEAQLSWPIALFGSPSPQLTNYQMVDHHYNGDFILDKGLNK